MKKYLFVLRHPPHSGCQVQEMLDIILTTAAFDQTVALLWLDDGVFQLKQHQQTEKYAGKNLIALWNALELYGINILYVETESLERRGLQINDLCLPVIAIQQAEIVPLMNTYNIVFSG